MKKIISGFFPFRKGKLYFCFLLIILIIAAFLRFYNFPYRYSLGEETIRDAVVGLEGARQFQMPLTGPFSSLGPFTFGPWYWLQLIIFSLLVPSYYAPWIYLSALSVLYVFIIFKIGELLEDKKLGLILAFLAALSPAQILSATHLTNPNNTNIFAVLIIWIFLKILLKNISFWWGFFLGLAIGIGTNIHFQMAGLIILPIVLFLHKKKSYIYFVTACLGIFVSFIPLLFFELNNHWFNTRNIMYYLLHGKNAIYVPNRWLFYIRDFWPAFWSDTIGIPTYAGVIIILLFLSVIVYLFLKKRLTLQISLLLVSFLFNFLLLRYYWGPRFFGYLNFLRVFVLIFTGFTIIKIYNLKFGKYLASLILIATIFFISPGVMDRLSKDPFSLEMYRQIAILEKKMPNKKFTFYGCSKVYRGRYDAIIFSSLFILNAKQKIDNSGVKIGLKSEDCIIPDNGIGINPFLNDIGLMDFSEKTSSVLLKAGWKPVSFSTIYDSSTRWWFKEQP